jgi:hypothetical protein
MWKHQYSSETSVAPEKLWETFAAIHSGKLVLPGGDRFEPEGDLAVGTRIAVTPAGQDTMTSVVSEFEPGKVYADETEYNGLVLTFAHLFEPQGARTRITHLLTIAGPDADEIGPKIGPQISSDFPEQMEALIEAARGS